jgi:hypothetical protein
VRTAAGIGLMIRGSSLLLLLAVAIAGAAFLIERENYTRIDRRSLTMGRPSLS